MIVKLMFFGQSWVFPQPLKAVLFHGGGYTIV